MPRSGTERGFASIGAVVRPAKKLGCDKGIGSEFFPGPRGPLNLVGTDAARASG